jgi:membrane fusion protein, multidrug efflux system
MRDRRIRVLSTALALTLAGWGAMGAVEKSTADAQKVYPGVTRPMNDRMIPFSYQGIVRKVLVKEGDLVKAGQPLMQLDDRIDQKELQKADIEANSELKVKYSEQERDLKKTQLARIQELYQKGVSASVSEVENARLEAQLADTHVLMSQEEQQTKKLDADRQRIKVELATLVSPIDGVVRQINVKEGEFADPQQSANRPVCEVVQNDPLKVEVFLPTVLVAGMKTGQELDVAYPNENFQKAKITFFDPVADAGSGMRRLHLEMPNPQQRESGWQVRVQIPGQ